MPSGWVNRIGIALAALAGVVRNGNLRRSELAWGAAITAEWAHFVALGVFAYDVGGTVAVGIAGLVRLLPAALVAPFAASLGDRFRRERFLVGVALVGSAALAGSAAAYYAGKNAVLVFVLAGLVGLASTLVRPALQALLPSLARTPQELIAANSATSTVEGLGTLVGPLAAGVLVSLADVGLVFAVGSVAFAAAAVLFARVRVEGRMHAVPASPVRGALRSVFSGFETALRERRPRLVIGLVFAQAFVRGCLNVLIVVTVFEVLDADPGAVGYLTAALGVGGLIGAFGSLAVVRHRLAVPFGLALVFWGLPIALVAPRPDLALALVLLAIVGAANSVEDVALFTLIQRIVPDEVLTRVLAVVWAVAMGAVALGSVAAPALVEAAGPRRALVVVGAILPLLTLLSWRGLVEIDKTVAAPTAELALVDAVPMFAPLSIAAKEYMARRLVSVPVSAGDVVIRAGDPGDRFYIVADGDFDVLADGADRKMVGGDYFGEIALLRDVPRTATIRAVVDGQLYALERADFLAAVTSHSAARVAGEAVVEERLTGTEPLRDRG
ncbi:MAG TPA: MFS transporter [Gaiellaceae bacterium]|nr:MFS transporter [Gaiellaceae bacterium]